MKRVFFAFAAALLLFLTVPLTALAENDFTVTNRSSQDIVLIFIAPPSEQNWGENWLAAAKYGVIVPGDHAMFRIDGGCEKDVKVTYRDSHSREYYNFDTCKYNLEPHG
jgi:hypothetical protein